MNPEPRKRGRPSNLERTKRALPSLQDCVKFVVPAEPADEQIITDAETVQYSLIPPDWVKGQLLNVRNSGDGYRVTLLAEESDPRHPERTLFFPNSWECQQFVSDWYNRQSADPRA